MYKYDEDNCYTINAALQNIRTKLEIVYWNKYQKEMPNPFDNTGTEYSNDTFTVRAYYWGDDDERYNMPNFEYKDLKVYWYKYLGRGMRAVADEKLTADYIETMIKECIKSIYEGEMRE
jgi:hypothetical protein